MSTPEVEPEADADSSAEDWRFDQLTRAGYPDGIALLLSGARYIDLHVACDLLARGCDPLTAWRILT